MTMRQRLHQKFVASTPYHLVSSTDEQYVYVMATEDEMMEFIEEELSQQSKSLIRVIKKTYKVFSKKEFKKL